MFDLFPEVIKESGDKENTEYTEKQFAVFASEFHSESHSVILCKMNEKPVGNTDFLTQVHSEFNPPFNHLVNEQDAENDKERSFQNRSFPDKLIAVLLQFRFHTLRGMGNCAQALFWYQLAGNATDAVRFVFDTH
jgi:hypothetical protein